MKYWRSLGGISFRVVATGSVLLAALLIIFEWKVIATFDALQERSAAQLANLENIGGIERLRIAIIDMETGVRGYLLAGDQRFLEPFERGQTDFQNSLQGMLASMRDQPLQVAALKILEQRESSWRRDYLQPMIVRRTNALNERDLAGLRAEVASAAGKKRVDEMRAMIDGMLDRESAVARATGESLGDLLQRARQALLLSGALLISFAVLLGWVIFRSLRTLRQRNAALSAENRARREAESAVLRATELQRAIVDSADYAIIATDANGMVRSFNKAAERMVGTTAGKVIGRSTLGEFFPAAQLASRAAEFSSELGREVKPGTETLLMKSTLGLRNEHEWDLLRVDGSTMAVQLSLAALLGTQGEINGYVGIAQDITERKRMQQLKQEFVSTVSHELRTPLAAVIGALSLLEQNEAGEIPQPAREFVRMAYDSSLRLAALVNDILDVDRIESTELTLAPSHWPVEKLLVEALQKHGKLAEQHGVLLHLDSPVPTATIHVDRDRLLQVVGNLLANACKFSPPGHMVKLAASLQSRQIRISVFDHGPGIPEAFRAHIFDKFARADSSDTRQQGGTGLGLAISKALVTRMGGRIGFESPAGMATEFYVEFPVAGD